MNELPLQRQQVESADYEETVVHGTRLLLPRQTRTWNELIGDARPAKIARTDQNLENQPSLTSQRRPTQSKPPSASHPFQPSSPLQHRFPSHHAAQVQGYSLQAPSQAPASGPLTPHTYHAAGTQTTPGLQPPPQAPSPAAKTPRPPQSQQRQDFASQTTPGLEAAAHPRRLDASGLHDAGSSQDPSSQSASQASTADLDNTQPHPPLIGQLLNGAVHLALPAPGTDPTTSHHPASADGAPPLMPLPASDLGASSSQHPGSIQHTSQPPQASTHCHTTRPWSDDPMDQTGAEVDAPPGPQIAACLHSAVILLPCAGDVDKTVNTASGRQATASLQLLVRLLPDGGLAAAGSDTDSESLPTTPLPDAVIEVPGAGTARADDVVAVAAARDAAVQQELEEELERLRPLHEGELLRKLHRESGRAAPVAALPATTEEPETTHSVEALEHDRIALKIAEYWEQDEVARVAAKHTWEQKMQELKQAGHVPSILQDLTEFADFGSPAMLVKSIVNMK